MRITVHGYCASARALRGDLDLAGYAVVETGARYTIWIDEGADGEILVDSIEGKIDQAIVQHLRELASLPLKVHTIGGIQSEFEIRIGVPPDEAEQRAIEKAILRGLLCLGDPRAQPEEAPRPPWFRRAFDWLADRIGRLVNKKNV